MLAGDGMAAGSGVVPLLERCWDAVVEVAKLLHRDGMASHSDVCTALGLSDRGGPGSAELSLIRSGRAPGSFHITRALTA